MSTFENVYTSLQAIASLREPDVIGNPLSWYALLVRCHAEKNVSNMLAALGIEQYLPLYHKVTTWSDRVKRVELPLFPGYVFCRVDIPRRRPVVTVPGVLSIVGFGSTFVPIPEEQISAVREIVRSGLRSGPWPFLQEGQRIRVTAGALEGLEGILVKSKDEYRVVVSVSLLQRSVAVEIERDWVQPLAPVHAC